MPMRSQLESALRGSADCPADAPPLPLIHARFGQVRHIWLRRHNKVAQGISYFLAERTQRWHSFEHAARPAPEFDFAAIDELVDRCIEFDHAWKAISAATVSGRSCWSMKKLAGTYEATIRGVLAFLGVPTDAPLAPSRFQRMADERSLAWEREYRARKGTKVSSYAPSAAATSARDTTRPRRQQRCRDRMPWPTQ